MVDEGWSSSLPRARPRHGPLGRAPFAPSRLALSRSTKTTRAAAELEAVLRRRVAPSASRRSSTPAGRVWSAVTRRRRGVGALALADTLELRRSAAALAPSRRAGMRGDEGDLEQAVELGARRSPSGSRVRGYEPADHLHLQADVKYWTCDYPLVSAGSRARIAGDVTARTAPPRRRIEPWPVSASSSTRRHWPSRGDDGIARELGGSARPAEYQSVISERSSTGVGRGASAALGIPEPRVHDAAPLRSRYLLHTRAAGDVVQPRATARPLVGRLVGHGWTRCPRGRGRRPAEIAAHLEPPRLAASASTRSEVTFDAAGEYRLRHAAPRQRAVDLDAG